MISACQVENLVQVPDWLRPCLVEAVLGGREHGGVLRHMPFDATPVMEWR